MCARAKKNVNFVRFSHENCTNFYTIFAHKLHKFYAFFVQKFTQTLRLFFRLDTTDNVVVVVVCRNCMLLTLYCCGCLMK